jgi:hypothetical protein
MFLTEGHLHAIKIVLAKELTLAASNFLYRICAFWIIPTNYRNKPV